MDDTKKSFRFKEVADSNNGDEDSEADQNKPVKKVEKSSEKQTGEKKLRAKEEEKSAPTSVDNENAPQETSHDNDEVPINNTNDTSRENNSLMQGRFKEHEKKDNSDDGAFPLTDNEKVMTPEQLEKFKVKDPVDDVAEEANVDVEASTTPEAHSSMPEEMGTGGGSDENRYRFRR